MTRTNNKARNRKRAAPPKKRKAKSKKPKTQETPSEAKESTPVSSPSKPQPECLPSHSHTDEDLEKLLEPYSKDQLITFLADAALASPTLLSRIQSLADRDVSHRKVFVHGLSWDTTYDDLLGAFSPFGAIEDCKVVLDKLTGRAKGYGFVLFASRADAEAALKQPQKKIRSRMASCQLASTGPVPHGASAAADTAGRKLYVSNVHADAAPDRLREFFARFGEIETGPLGYDMLTGKSRGFALFVYKTPEGLRKALEEPYKMFEGHQLHCQKAAESGKGKGVAPAAAVAAITPAATGAGALGASTQQVLAAVAAAQKLALYGQNAANPAALLAQNPLVAAAVNQAAALNPVLNQAAALNQAAVLNQAAALNPAALAALNAAGTSGLGALGGSSPVPGAYGSQGTVGFQGLQRGQSPLGRPSGSYGGASLFW